MDFRQLLHESLEYASLTTNILLYEFFLHKHAMLVIKQQVSKKCYSIELSLFGHHRDHLGIHTIPIITCKFKLNLLPNNLYIYRPFLIALFFICKHTLLCTTSYKICNHSSSSSFPYFRAFVATIEARPLRPLLYSIVSTNPRISLLLNE